MRKILIMCMLLVVMQARGADNFTGFSVMLKNGQMVDFLFDEIPIVKFDNENLIVNSLSASSVFAKNNVNGFSYFKTSTTGIREAGGENRLRFEYVDRILTIYGIRPNSVIKVIAADGMSVFSDTTNENVMTIPFGEYIPGVYIVSVNDQIIKIKR